MNIDEKIIISQLLDYYGPLLPEQQRSILKQRLDEDLSLAEVADNIGITRQGVRDSEARGIKMLNEFEEKLGLRKRLECIRNAVLWLVESVTSGETAEIKARAEELIKLTED
jgi:predicted DNA-binding protein YlxM (UPF0122 family)